MSQQRVLAAIMFTDIVGYTALMGEDSAKALELIRISKEIQKPLVEKYNGKWLKEMGDGAMSQFSSALDALNCSIEIQKSARAELDAKLRIGIHLGDVTVEEEDVHGDGVNVASRLESIADPGGIYISESIEKAIQGQTDIQAKYLGEAKLKNVAYGVRTYAVQGVGLPVPEVNQEKHLSGHFWAEVQRRGVGRAGATYIVLSLLLILLAPYASSLLNLPEWFSNAIWGALLVGFPIAMYLAWNYERSPEGFVRTTSEQSWQNPYSSAQKKPLTSNVIIVLLVLIIAAMYFFPQRFGLGNNPTINDKSLAVLYFANMSGDEEQEYFSDGVAEEIIAHLSQLKDIRVVSRTSVLPYKGKGMNIKDIAIELNVQTILEGSVRRSGNKVRITAQLINAQTDENLWTEIYDRKLADIFEIQSSVARSIAEKFEVNISPEANLRIEQLPTQDFKAYDLFLQARRIAFRTQGIGIGSNNRNRERALGYLNQAITLDPSYAQAMALKSRIYNDLSAVWPSKRHLRDSAAFLAKESIIYNPEIADGYIALGESVQNFDQALLWFERAYRIDPANGLSMLAERHFWQSRMPRAMEYVAQEISREPNSLEGYELKARIYLYFGLEYSVRKYLDMAKQLNPQAMTIY